MHVQVVRDATNQSLRRIASVQRASTACAWRDALTAASLSDRWPQLCPLTWYAVVVPALSVRSDRSLGALVGCRRARCRGRARSRGALGTLTQ